ncbi:Hypothetical protein IALB_3132 [Ignavibacterium album JCM 16511]|uniref:Alginate export domain-containing protein n=1 Tax=Ignavibacterium album (strain DSM 19864 / JCM 16511 / NBRC 101810 / Mat9-16) TaxID=945713 RepID=I0APC8_IGNAJ|nr:hypothetical protein [Ignavibacterium album]AFH50835.1 Hypothetical protein IALB_3132 [Ignavibacterium album JCM 16511]
MRKSHLYFLFLILLSQITPAQDNFDAGGYAKYLFSTSEYPQLNERLYDHIIHSRLNTKYFFDDSFSLTAEFRFRSFFGNSIKKISNFSELIKTYQPLVDLDWLVWQNQNTVGYAEVDRLYIDYNANDVQVTVGRQRIAWGTSWVWNSTDLFNPLSILDFDYEELPGNDALRVQYYTGAVSKIEFALAPDRKKNKLTSAALISYNAFDYDFNFIAGIKNNRWITGFSWVGDIQGAGFRGEVTIQEKPERLSEYELLYSQFELQPISYSNKNLFSFVLSGDYTFPNSFYIHTEVLYNNIGKEENTALFSLEAKEIGLLSPSRFSVYQEFSYNISPLTRASAFGIYNPGDKSFVIVPSINYSVITNLDLYLISLIFDGKKFTQYGDYGTSFIARIKYSF